MRIFLALCAVALACATHTQAATPKKSTQSKTPTEKPSPFSTVPLDPSIEALPRRYLGHSCRAIAKNISARDVKKGEFETTAAYQARLDAMSSSPILGTTSLNDVIGFVQAADVYSGISETYDADRAVLKVNARWDASTQSVDSQILRSVRLDQKITSTRSYVASNAYGKKVNVDSSRWDVCGVAFSNLTYRDSLTSGSKNIEELIEMSADDARSAKGNLALMFVGSMSAPYVSEFHDYSEATIDDPTEMTWGGNLLVMKLVQVWVFNRQSGKIYKKVDI